MLYRLGMTVVTSSHTSMDAIGATFNALSAMDVLFNVISIGLAAAAFFLLRRPPTPVYGTW